MLRHRLSLVVLFAWAGVAVGAESAPSILVVTDRPDAMYSVGQKVKFTVTIKNASPGEVTFALDKDGMPPMLQEKVKVQNNSASFEGTLPEPGFLRCRAWFVDKDKKNVSATAAAGFDPLKIPPSMPVPEDFDQFWAGQKAKLAAVALKPELTGVKVSVEGVEAFDVQIPCIGKPVSGYFARPMGAKAKSLPAILFVHGAGVRSSSLPGPAGAAKGYNALAMDINAHGIPNGKPDSFYKELMDGALKNYRYDGREDRETCYFLGMFLRLQRAMDFLCAQPEWDGKVLIVKGSSQGGGQAIAAAGLDPRVTLFCAGVPAICDHSGKAAGRINGWPKLVPETELKPDPKVLQVSRYFDCMNFATRTKAQAVFSVGFIDGVCPPTSVYATYNNISGTKQIVNEPLMGHASSKAFEAVCGKVMKEHVAAKK